MSNNPPTRTRPSISRAFNRFTTLLSLALILGAGYLGYQVLRNGVAADVYHDRLVQLNDEHHELIDQYNQAVTRTAVTELVIQNGTVCVNVRTADGRVEPHPVDADPSHEIYVDYVVKGNRLLIRRVFDSRSAPDDSGLIDSALLDLDWSDPTLKHGQSISRRFTDGRWIVTVSGDGALALAKIDHHVEVELQRPPKIEDFDPVSATQNQIKQISPADVYSRYFGGGKN